MGIVVVMLSLLLPAVKAMTGSAGRQGAINELLAAFDLARVTALREGTEVFVGFADATFPDPDMRYRGYILFRRVADGDAAGAGSYEFLTRWRKLPTGVSFASGIQRSMVGSGESITVEAEEKFPGIETSGTIPVVRFGPHGGVNKPSAEHLRLFLYEGFYDAGSDVVTQSRDQLYDVIALARLTGRPRVEVSSRAQ